MTTKLRRLAYLAYYFKQLDWPLVAKFMNYVEDQTGRSSAKQWRYILTDSLRYNISPLEYFQFRFFEQTDDEKAQWAGTGTMYEFQRKANPAGSRMLLLDKRLFFKKYRKFFRHELYTLDELQSSHSLLADILADNDKLVFKESTGNCGSGVAIRSTGTISTGDMFEYMKDHEFDLVETYIEQHPSLMSLSPSAVNTVRIITQIRESGAYEILGCRLRISVNSEVDNLAAGNLAAPIDTETGIVDGPGVYADMTREPESIHPTSGQAIVGFQVPFWSDTLAMVREASLLDTQNRSIGWDIAITEEGPGLIEGNHDWCKLVWQLPVNRGLKHLLDAA